MIAVKLIGGLGNQLFQVAAAFQLQEMTGREVVLDRSWFDREQTYTPDRPLGVAGVTGDLRVVSLSITKLRIFWRIGEPWQVTQHDLAEDALTRVTRRTRIVHGFFQQAHTPLTVTPALARALGAAHPEVLAAASISPYVGVHVRLGDYLSHAGTRRFHGVTDPIDLVARARARADALGGLPVRVFTDSPDEFARLAPGALGDGVTLSAATDAWSVLAELSHSRAIVMANSSLSWWAAFIATAVRGDMVSVDIPRPWNAQQSGMDSALLLDGWTPFARRLLAE